MPISSILPRFFLPEQQPINISARKRSRLPDFVRQCPVALHYLDLLGPLPWDNFPEPFRPRTWLHDGCLSKAAFLAACFIRLDQRMTYATQLVSYLVQHPALLWLLGFPLIRDTSKPYGFDPQASMPTQRHLNRLLRQTPNELAQWLLDASVDLLRAELKTVVPDFGQVISLDTKHVIAWVKENNPKAYIKQDRFDKNKQPAGDPDCKLGCKRRHNRKYPTPTTNPVPYASLSVGEYYWGYGSGVVATKASEWGEIVLAELTLPFNKGDTTYFFPLMADTERRLGFRPRFGAFDAAFDAFYVYDYFASTKHDGFAAVPFSEKGNTKSRKFDEYGNPFCPGELPMIPKTTYTDRTKTIIVHQRTRYACPLVHHQPTGATCPVNHDRWPNGGCTSDLPAAVGTRIRYQLDRHSEIYKIIYNQRSATERINSQAKNLGIERPHLRNGKAIANINSLIYVLINLRALQRIRTRRLSQP